MAKKTDAQKEAQRERVKEIALKALDVLKELARNPLFSSAAMYALLHYLGQLKNMDGNQYLMSEPVLRTLKGLAAAYPIFSATQGGTAGVAAGVAAAAAVGIAADRPGIPKDPVRLFPPEVLLPEQVFPSTPGFPGFDPGAEFG